MERLTPYLPSLLLLRNLPENLRLEMLVEKFVKETAFPGKLKCDCGKFAVIYVYRYIICCQTFTLTDHFYILFAELTHEFLQILEKTPSRLKRIRNWRVKHNLV